MIWVNLIKVMACWVVLASLAACITKMLPLQRPATDSVKQLETLIALGMGYIRNGEYARAKDNLTKALLLNPQAAPTHNALGLLFQLEGEFTLSESHFRQAIASKLDFTQARNNFGAFLFAQKRYLEAADQLEIAVEDRFYQNRSQVFENLGVSYLRLDKAQRAEQALLRAVQLNPSQPRALLELTEIRLQQQDYSEARDYYLRHVKMVNPSAQSLWVCIRLSRLYNKHDEEAGCALELENTFPNSAEFRTYKTTILP